MVKPENKDLEHNIFYRKCSELEASIIEEEKRLPEGGHPFFRDGILCRSEPHKWITVKPEFAERYFPKKTDKEHYSHIAVIYTPIGTLPALQKEKINGVVIRGPRAAYGIPENLLPWFNNRITNVETYDLRTDDFSEGDNVPSFHLLRTEENMYATFMAFSEEYLDLPNFADNVKRSRMSWVKTSLLWTIWRSNWGRKEYMEKIIEVPVSEEYMEYLFDVCVNTKNSSKEDNILCQHDPDRRIIGRRWMEGDDYFVRAGTTAHFGIRDEELAYFIDNVSAGSITDITDVVQSVLKERPVHPTRTLYDKLSYFVEQREK